MCMRVSPTDSGNSGILFVGFNQDYGCFAVGMQNGFRIFNSDPLKQLERHEFDIRDGTGVGYMEMLFRTNLLGILGGGNHSRLASNMACLWDGIKQQFVLEITCATDIRGIRLRHDRIIIVLVNAIKVYTFNPSPQLIFESKTCSNPLGLCYVCQSVDNPLVVFPGRRPGAVSLVHIGNATSSSNVNSGSGNLSSTINNTMNIGDNNTNVGSSSPLFMNYVCPSSTNATNMPPRQIVAHENPLASISLSRDGYLLATASKKGTLVRVFSTKDCSLLHELRRGTSQATITSLSFNKDSDLLCVTSERGTAHIFCLTKDSSPYPHNFPVGGGSGSSNNSPHFAKSSGSGSGKLFPRSLFSTTSHVRCVLETKFKAICAFSSVSPDTLIVLAADGSYYKYTFTANGTVTRVTFVNFLDFYDDESDF
ncbi:WD repeat domain phosphoinositide-interacting protein isoform 2 [Schistosoma japonicum]|uniref:WD repeat domain phosphoinositide-interacting protein isoform 2 n=1 Tax=Schistosoma japonicum TaxID=6182 RepID=A0A4Z2DE46_SCHJA|nr:WD repeat domain phosphoinositide-interacting protein isoform 2 [Schistosoma japonicum]